MSGRTRGELTRRIKAEVLALGLDAVGVASAEPSGEAASRIKDQIVRGLRTQAWRGEDIGAFTDPRRFLPEAESVIVVAECYLTSEAAPEATPGSPRGTVARYTWRNYYKDVRTKLKKLGKWLKSELGPEFRYRALSNGPLAEKPLAERAGLGWYGHHGIILTPDWGSWVVLGELIVNVPLEPDEPLAKSCGECRECMDACPTGAIVEPRVLDLGRCLQYLSHHPVDVPEDAREAWGRRLYGCTTCQDVCPVNRKVRPPERKPDYGLVGPEVELLALLEMSEDEYRERFRGNQMGAGWVSFEAVQRNAVLALAHSSDPAALPALDRLSRTHPSPLVRRHASWALKRV